MKIFSKASALMFNVAATVFILLSPCAYIVVTSNAAAAELVGGVAQRQAPPAMLVAPQNGQLTNGQYQLFVWLPPNPAPVGKVTYQLSITPVFPDQSPEAAVQFNAPHLIKEGLDRTSFECSGAPPFLDGGKCAWQIKVYLDGVLLKASEVRSFSFVQSLPSSTGNTRISLLQPSPQLPACPSGLFEAGNLNNEPGWVGLTGSNSTLGATMNAVGFVAGRHTVMTGPGVDPVLAQAGIMLPTVREGHYSVRLGNDSKDAQAEQLRYTFVVNGNKPSFTFSYAVVLEEPNHSLNEQPFFRYRVLVGNNPVKDVLKYAAKNDPYFKNTSNNLVYKSWDCETVDLSNYVGQPVTIEFTTGDCTQGGHFGYAYIDGFCDALLVAAFTMPDTVCANGPLWADGTASANETDYFWSIEESDQWWGRNPTTEVSQWFTAQQAGPIDLQDFYQSKGGHFKCNTYYRVKLAVGNHCISWKDTVKLLYINPCPTANAGPDRSICCTTAQPVQIGTPAQPGYIYSWTSVPPGFTSNQAQPFVKPACDTTYTLTVTDTNGCPATDVVKVFVGAPFKVSITKTESAYQCEQTATLIANLELDGPCSGGNCSHQGMKTGADNSIVWSTGETSPAIAVNPSVPTTYSVTVSNACFTKKAQITVQPCHSFTGGGPDLIYPNAFTPNGDGLNDIYTIYQLGLNANEAPAYNALEYRFIVYNRWGNNLYQKNGLTTRCVGFKNGEITWDGKPDNSSAVVPQDTYNWTLDIKNCSHRDEWYRIRVGSVTVVK